MLSITRFLMCTKKSTVESLAKSKDYSKFCDASLDGRDPKLETFRLDLLLAVVVALYWIKIILLFQVTKTFGPIIKIIALMTKDLAQFLVLWSVILLVFTSVACILFGDITTTTAMEKEGQTGFDNFVFVAVMYFESALGNWDMSVYSASKEGAFAIYFHCLFLTLNMILLLNFVIAILSSTFASYEDKGLGLYYEAVIKKFS